MVINWKQFSKIRTAELMVIGLMFLWISTLDLNEFF
jgi:hypothetical protein